MPVKSTIERILAAEWPAVKRQLWSPPAAPFDPRSLVDPMPKDFISWDHRLTPGFPSLWPCPPNGELIYYAWAAGLQPRVLTDAVRTTLPWARFTVSLSDGKVQYERLGEKPEMGGVQGFWPLSPAESTFFGEARTLFDECPAVLSGQAGPPDDAWLERAKRSYRFWIECNGTIAQRIRKAHDSFFAWVEPVS
jgi:hypothetical protein